MFPAKYVVLDVLKNLFVYDWILQKTVGLHYYKKQKVHERSQKCFQINLVLHTVWIPDNS